MEENDVIVGVDAAFLMAAKIERALNECNGKYKVNQEVYRRVLDLYKEADAIARDNWGKIVWVKAKAPGSTQIVIDVVSIQSNGEKETQGFVKLLDKVDHLNVVNINRGDGVRLMFDVYGLWEECDSNE